MRLGYIAGILYVSLISLSDLSPHTNSQLSHNAQRLCTMYLAVFKMAALLYTRVGSGRALRAIDSVPSVVVAAAAPLFDVSSAAL